jgi:hypothetical protein
VVTQGFKEPSSAMMVMVLTTTVVPALARSSLDGLVPVVLVPVCLSHNSKTCEAFLCFFSTSLHFELGLFRLTPLKLVAVMVWSEDLRLAMTVTLPTEMDAALVYVPVFIQNFSLIPIFSVYFKHYSRRVFFF